jgi:hypothetical protein
MVSLEATPEELLATLDNDLQRVYAISTPNVTLTDLLLVQIAREIKKLAPPPVAARETPAKDVNPPTPQPQTQTSRSDRRR